MWKSKLKNLEKIFKKHLHYVVNGAKLRSVDNKTKTTNKKIKNNEKSSEEEFRRQSRLRSNSLGKEEQ